MRIIILLLLSLATEIANGQSQTKRVLFLGNSYTSTNDLPQMIANVANSVGDTLEWDVEAPGGYYLYDHLIPS